MTRDAEILKFSTYARRVPKPDRGACSCRRHIVRVFEAIECGAFETHSRRRCVFRKSRTVISAPAW